MEGSNIRGRCERPERADKEGRVSQVAGSGVMGHKGVGRQGIRGPLAEVGVGCLQWCARKLVLVPLQKHGGHLRM